MMIRDCINRLRVYGRTSLPVLLFANLPLPAFSMGTGLENQRYRILVTSDASVEITLVQGGEPVRFFPRFTVLHRSDDPALSPRGTASEAAFRVPAWKSARSAEPTMDLFQAATSTDLTAVRAERTQGKIQWTFPAGRDFRLDAEMTLLAGRADPQIAFRFTPLADGWYSVGYTGCPQAPPSEIESIWQPLVWQERRFPERTYFSLEYMAPLPATLVTAHGVTVGVVADPSEVPFRLPTFRNSRFGVLVRNDYGNAQPMIFAPVLGNADSRMSPSTTFSFKLRLLMRRGGWFEAFRHVARDIYRFHDYRQNVGGSLNDTLDNMIDFVLDDHYSGWVPDLKAFKYTDVARTVKLVSSLHPLSLSIIRDSKEMFLRQALPMMEYVMSRQKYLFSLQDNIKEQSPSHFLGGPCVEVSELSALFSMSRGRSLVFRHYAEQIYPKARALNLDMVSEGRSFQNSLALYRLGGERRYLDNAEEGADRYIHDRIDRAQADFSDVHVKEGGQFWTDFAPKWIDLLELYETTGEKRYLRAATAGAEEFAAYVWMSPPVPGKEIVVNKGGRVDRPRLKRVPEQWVRAWRVSQAGLMSESSRTYPENYAIFLSHYAAYMLRLAYYTGDSFFRDIARSAVVGRYSNYPGYNISPGDWTTVYQRPDFPLHPARSTSDDWTNAAMGYGSYYYNHIWPNIGLLMDYLVSDAFTRSKGAIQFPSEYAQGYAYLQSKVYGDRPGTFYGDSGVRLWIPRRLLRPDNIQANYISGYGNGNFYLALLNQSISPIHVKVLLNPDVIPVDVGRLYKVRVWQENVRQAPATLRGGSLSALVQPKGITALVVEGLRVTTQFQDEVFDPAATPLSDRSYASVDSPMGSITGMMMSMGRSLSTAYVWLQATEKQLREARLHYKGSGGWEVMVDSQYPFEFTLALEDQQPAFEFWVEGVTTNGQRTQSEVIELRR